MTVPEQPCPPDCGGDWTGEGSCAYRDTGYLWCRPCREHHRPPECAVDEQGRALAPCGCPWNLLDEHLPTCREVVP
jgi:hypothetical protein